jgi:hypothetical protein
MNNSNPFEWIHTDNERISFRLRNFTFFHRSSTEEAIDPKYRPESNPLHQLSNWLKENQSDSGTYLITGYRGAGKSSFVNYTINELNKKDPGNTQYIPISISLGQENMQEIEILRILAKNLKNKLEDGRSWWMKVVEALHSFIAVAYILFTMLTVMILSLPDIPDYCESDWLCTLIGNWKNVSIAILAFVGVEAVMNYMLPQISPYYRAYKQIRKLCARLNATITQETAMQWTDKIKELTSILGLSRSKTQTTPPASIQEIEFELIKVLDLVKRAKTCRRFIFIIDELDKVDTNHRNITDADRQFPEYEKLTTRPEQHVSSRARTQQVLSIIASMKFFLSTAKAYFIFIAGRELYEAFQADMCDRDFSISSIFNGVLNLESFLNGNNSRNNSTLRTEEFVCYLLLPPHFEQETISSKYYNSSQPFSLKNYYRFRQAHKEWMENETDKERAIRLEQELLFLNRFITYLAFISNGSPKKLTLFFEKYVRNRTYLEKKDIILPHEEPCIEKQGKDNLLYLSFGRHSIQKINFIHYLVYPIFQTLLNQNSDFGDKLMVSASFLVTHILKLHNNGFSWRNLEQVPELQELNKAPEMRDYVSTVINFMNHSLITTIPCGLYHYKFPMRIIEEISYQSKVSGEMSTLFNFSSLDLQSLKNQYLEIIRQNTTVNGTHDYSQYALASIHHSLGDLFTLEENYSAAIRAYERCIELVVPIFEDYTYTKMVQAENYLLFLNRSMLKLGVAHEKRKTDNSAFILYDELIMLLKGHNLKWKYAALYRDTRTLHLAILAKLFVLEKIDTEGINLIHLEEAYNNFLEIRGKNTDHKKNDLIEADFFRKMGDILYYKNQTFKTTIQDMPYGEFSAKSCYLKSIMTLMEDKRYKLNSEDLNNTYEVCFRIFQYASLFKQQSGQTDSASNHRDNISYHFALACESMGNVCLYDNKDHNDYHADELHSFCTEFNKTIQQYLYKTDGQPIFEWSVINVLKWHFNNTIITTSFSRAILFYWIAAGLYNVSCERGAATKCHKNIIYTLLLYVRTCLKNNESINGYEILSLMETIIQHFLISLHRQKEHIHLAELSRIQWMETLEMYEQIDLESLSNTPDLEEIIFLYQTTRLELWRNKNTKWEKEKLSDRDGRIKMGKSLGKFYRSSLMTGHHLFQTMFSSTQLLKLKTRFNHSLLYIMLRPTDKTNWKLNELTLKELHEYIQNGNPETQEDIRMLTEMYEIKRTETKEAEEKRMDLLEMLICDSMYCLSQIQNQIVPIQNSNLFNNSFKADVFYLQYVTGTLYQKLYCYYAYGMTQNQAKIQQYLNLKENDIDLMKTTAYNEQRRKNLYNRVSTYLRKGTPSYTNSTYLAERCIHYYTKARQTHSQGKTYQETIRNLYFLDDDLNNDCLPFYMAVERLELALKHIQERENYLKQLFQKNGLYQASNYWVTET